MGMNRQEIMATRFGEMIDMMNCLAIYNGQAKEKKDNRLHRFDDVIALR